METASVVYSLINIIERGRKKRKDTESMMQLMKKGQT